MGLGDDGGLMESSIQSDSIEFMRYDMKLASRFIFRDDLKEHQQRCQWSAREFVI
jgi:hypothetical protein